MTQRSKQPIHRIEPVTAGRSPGSRWNGLVFVAAVAADDQQGFTEQCHATFNRLDTLLATLDSSKRTILSASIHLRNMQDKAEFDRLWLSWIGDQPDCWPQRTCVEGGLAANYLVEIQLTAVEEHLVSA